VTNKIQWSLSAATLIDIFFHLNEKTLGA